MIRKTFLILSIAALGAMTGNVIAQPATASSAPAAQTAPGNGPVARAEESVKKAGRATKRGAVKAGAATKRGAKKAAAAVTSTGEKIEKKLPPNPHPENAKTDKMKS